MKRRIQRSMSIVLCVTLCISYVLFTGLVYRQNLNNMKKEVKQEAIYISSALNLSETAYIQVIDNCRKTSRITIIGKDGTVRYDSVEDVKKMKNHKHRTEIISAFKNGVGETTRMSNTLGKRTFYYALRLADGSVVRISKTIGSVMDTIVTLLPVMGIIAAFMLLFAVLLARWQTTRLIRPINEIDLEHPFANTIYEELAPLLKGIDVQNKEKDKVAQMRKEFSANVSHELKTPLTSISGYAEIMKNGMVKPEDVPAFSERIFNEASRLISLIGDIIKLSKLDENSQDIEKKEVDLYELTREICSRLAPQAEKKQVHIEVSGESVIYEGIPQILDEMIYNICENAIKYNYEQGTVNIWAGRTLQGIKIIISDTGIGIPLEHQERIFERFYRVDKSHSKETGGTGLGLSIVKHGALLHGATIKVTSKEKEGTKIELIF
ncbi:MAG: ATP-binding protein [Lachnospiraceae bacterium]